MKSVVVVGAQWGDEGKGKVVDYLAGSFDYIARVAGGHNAGHTVIIEKDRFVLQLIPCGILRPKRHAVIGTGVVVDPAALVAEIETLSKEGIDVKGRLHVSNRAHLIFPYHRELDKAAEGARGANKIGTTSRGIGPAYEDKMARRGLRICDLLEPELFRKKAAHVVAEKNRLAKGAYGADIDFSHVVEETLKLSEKIREYICDTAELVNRALDEGKSVLFEGAQGTMLDIDHGTYPFGTSSIVPCAPSNSTDFPSSSARYTNSAVSQMYPRIFSPSFSVSSTSCEKSMCAPYAPLARRFFSATTCAAFFRNNSGSSKSHIRSPRRAILSS